MRSINALLQEIHASQREVRNAICQNTPELVLPFLDIAKEYLLANDLSKSTWSLLCEEDKEAFYLFILMNELFHYRSSPKNFLVNASFYFPKDSSLHARLKLFAKLSKISHVQDQYEALVIDFLHEANKIHNMEDPYLEKDSVRQLLLNYFATFIETVRICLVNLGQASVVESILPTVVLKINGNEFAMASISGLIAIFKGTFDRGSLQIRFCPPAL